MTWLKRQQAQDQRRQRRQSHARAFLVTVAGPLLGESSAFHGRWPWRLTVATGLTWPWCVGW
jgi:hypothetical protein